MTPSTIETIKTFLGIKKNRSLVVVDFGAGDTILYKHIWASGHTYFAVDTDPKIQQLLIERGVDVVDASMLSKMRVKADVILVGNMSFLADLDEQLARIPQHDDAVVIKWEDDSYNVSFTVKN